MTNRSVLAIVCDTIHPYSHGGREQRYHELARRLTDGFDVHVYTMHWWDGPQVHEDGGVTFHAISPLLPLYTKGRRSIKQALFFALGCLRLIRSDFDVLDADQMPYFQVFILRAIALLKRKPFVVTWHEVWSRSYWFNYLGWSGMAGWVIESFAMRMPRVIVAASPHTADRLRGVLGKRTIIATVPNGIDLDTIRDTPASPDVADLVVVGRLIDHKRVDLLLEAVAVLHKRGLPVTCRVIGDGPDRDALHEQAQLLGIEHAVTFHHDIAEQKDVYSLLKASRVFVSPSAREGFGISVLEALACGLNVVTTSAPDNLARHLVERSSRGVVCEPGPDSLADAIAGYVAEPGGLPPSASSTDPWIGDYDWNLIAKRATDLYNQVARGTMMKSGAAWN